MGRLVAQEHLSKGRVTVSKELKFELQRVCNIHTQHLQKARQVFEPVQLEHLGRFQIY